MQTSRAMATALNVVQTPHSYGDLMLLTKAAQANQVCNFFFLFSIAFTIYILPNYSYFISIVSFKPFSTYIFRKLLI